VQSEAEMSGADHGLYLERSDGFNGTQYAGYWLRRYDQGWSDPRGSAEVLETFTFSEDVEISLALIGDPEVEITDRDPDLNPAPQIVLFAGGEVTEGELDWTDPRSGELLYRLRWDLLGRIEFLPKGEAPDDETLR